MKKERRNKIKKGSDGHVGSGELGHHVMKEVEVDPQVVDVGGGDSSSGDDEGCEVVAGSMEKGTVRRLVSFIGDRIWGVWN